MNRVILVGNIIADPELKFMPSGSAVCNARLVTNNRYKDKQGNKVDDPSFHNLTVFGKPAEVFAEYVKKGSKLYVEGALKYDQYEKDGVKQYRTSITVSSFNFISGPSERVEEEPPVAQAKPKPKSAPVASQEEFGDIPF